MSKLDLIIKALQVSYAHVPGDIADRHHEALVAARELLDEPANPEPLGKIPTLAEMKKLLNGEPIELAKPEQKPVAWMYVNVDGECEQIEYGACDYDDPSITFLYTAPPRKECEIEQARREERGWCHQLVWDYGFSRVDNEDVQEACSILAKQILARSKK